MPVLDILDDNGGLRTHTAGINDAGIQVLAAMAYPNDPTQRELMIAAGIQDALQNSDRSVPPNISTPVFGAGGARGIQNNFDKVYDRGLATGETLVYLSRLAALHPRRATLGQARHLAYSARSEARIMDGKAPLASKRSFKAAWSDYRAVAHLWAAFVQYDADMLGHDKLPEFLGFADFYARFATDFHAPEAHERLMAGSELWEVPRFKGLPIIGPNPAMLSPDEKRRMETYKIEN